MAFVVLARILSLPCERTLQARHSGRAEGDDNKPPSPQGSLSTGFMCLSWNLGFVAPLILFGLFLPDWFTFQKNVLVACDNSPNDKLWIRSRKQALFSSLVNMSETDRAKRKNKKFITAQFKLFLFEILGYKQFLCESICSCK